MTESLWNKYDISRKSPEVPEAVKKERALELNTPCNSTAMGWKMYELVRLVYFSCLRLAARYAAAPADRGGDDRYDASIVLTTVTSQFKIFPLLLLYKENA